MTHIGLFARRLVFAASAVALGADALHALTGFGGAGTQVAAIVRASHERWDGGGYPDRLGAEQIPLGARIVSVCDAFNAMTTPRSYQRTRSREDAVAELRRCAGTQFDPAIVEAFCELALEPQPLPAVGAEAK